MAIINNNPLIKGLSGMLGRMLVFRQTGNRMVVSTAPRTVHKRSNAQQQHHQRFKAASAYASAQFKHTEGRAYYEALALKKPEVNAYNLALADYFHAPQVTEIDTSGYSGRKADRIWIQATDDAGVVAVKVSVHTEDGTLLETGFTNFKGTYWVYEMQQNLSHHHGLKLTIEAVDRPGNVTSVTHALQVIQ